MATPKVGRTGFRSDGVFMKLVSITGARPQFIKMALISRALRTVAQEVSVHTGQHYDPQLSPSLFEELRIPEPDYNLRVGSGANGWQTGQMLIRIEDVLLAERPDWVLVYGDTNSTLAGGLAAVKLGIPLAHVEAGLRSYNRNMPEEHNRVVTDHVSDLLFCPTQTSVNNLAREGISHGVHRVGDVMYDALLHHVALAEKCSKALARLELSERGYALATIHRPYNTEDPGRLQSILVALETIADEKPVVLPAHPRTRKAMDLLDYKPRSGLRVIEPVGYLDMLTLEKQAQLILTDSGGIQKEAYWLGVPCLTLREETEWVETVDSGWNILVGSSVERILEGYRDFYPSSGPRLEHYGNGDAAKRIVQILGQS